MARPQVSVVGDVALPGCLPRRSCHARCRLGPGMGRLVRHACRRLAGAAHGVGACGRVLAGRVPGWAPAPRSPARCSRADLVRSGGHVLRAHDGWWGGTALPLAGGCRLLAGLSAAVGCLGRHRSPPRPRSGALGVAGLRSGIPRCERRVGGGHASDSRLRHRRRVASGSGSCGGPTGVRPGARGRDRRNCRSSRCANGRPVGVVGLWPARLHCRGCGLRAGSECRDLCAWHAA